MGSLDCYFSFCWGESRQIQTNRRSPRARLPARPWLCKLSAPLWPCTTLPTSPNSRHLLWLKTLTVPVSPSIILFIFMGSSLSPSFPSPLPHRCPLSMRVGRYTDVVNITGVTLCHDIGFCSTVLYRHNPRAI